MSAKRTTTTATLVQDIVLQVTDLSVRYRRGAELIAAVSGASFSLERGSRLAIIGESGSGKSTIANSILGLLPNNSLVTSGAVRFEDVDLLGFRTEAEWNRVRGARVAFIPQDPTIALDPVMRVGDQVGETLRVHGGQAKKDARKRAVELLSAVGIRDSERVYRSYPHELSGGMRQRVLIAIALAGEPELIVADEPTSGLDVTVQKLVLDLLDEVVRSRGVSVILITHDLAVARARADYVLVLERGRIVESGATPEVLSTPSSPYTRRLLDAAPSVHEAKLAPSTDLLRLADEQKPDPTAAGTPLVQVRGLVKEYARKGPGGGTFRALDGVGFELWRNRSLGIVGESGSGKTTTARIVTGIEQADEGQVVWEGSDVTRRRGATRRRLFREIQYVFQNPYSSLNPRLTLSEIVAEPLVALERVGPAERNRRVAEVLDAVGLPAAYAARRPGELSGGQRQRVAIARALALRPTLLVLDEPVSALDVTVQAQILQLLVDLQLEYGLSYLFISHDLAVVRLLCDDVLVLEQGRAVEANTVAGLFSAPEQEYTRALLEAIP